MPYAEMREKKVIYKEDETKPILLILDQVAKDHGFDDQPDIVASEKHVRKSRWWTPLVTVAERITGNDIKTQERILQKINISLDAPAYELRNAYRRCLNKLILKLDLNSKDTEAVEINNRFVLIYEILLRLVTIALSKEMDPQKDGKKILAVMIDFIQAVNATDVLGNKNLLGNKISKMNIFFATTHQDWIEFISQMISAVQLFHQNIGATNLCWKHLHDTEYLIKCLLIAQYDENRVNEELSENWIDTTLETCEQKKFSLTAINSQDQKKELTDNIKEIVASDKFKEFHSDKQEKISILHGLLVETKILLQAVGRLDCFFSGTGWVALILGVLQLKSLAERIAEHGAKCRRHLRLREDDPIFMKPVGKALTAKLTKSAHWIELNALICSEGLEQLNDPDLLKKVGNIIKDIVNGLLESEEELGIPLVDKDRLKLLIGNIIKPTITLSASISASGNGPKTQSYSALTQFHKPPEKIEGLKDSAISTTPKNLKSQKHDSHTNPITAFAVLKNGDIVTAARGGLKIWDQQLHCKRSVALPGKFFRLLEIIDENRIALNVNSNILIIDSNNWEVKKDHSLSDLLVIEVMSINVDLYAYAVGYAIHFGKISNENELIEKDCKEFKLPSVWIMQQWSSAFNSNNQLLISGNKLIFTFNDGNILLRDIETKNEKNINAAMHGPINSLIRISENFFATSHKKGVLKIWDINACECVWSHALENNKNIVNCLMAISEQYLACGLSDGTILVWDITSRKDTKPIFTLKAESAVTALFMMPDKKTLLSGCQTGIIESWDIGILLNQHKKTVSNQEESKADKEEERKDTEIQLH